MKMKIAPPELYCGEKFSRSEVGVPCLYCLVGIIMYFFAILIYIRLNLLFFFYMSWILRDLTIDYSYALIMNDDLTAFM